MPTLTGTIRDGGGDPLAANIVFVRVGPPNLTGSTLSSRDRLGVTCAANGTFSASLTGGTWRMRWYLADYANEHLFTIPSTGGPYTLDDLNADALPTPEQPVQMYFTDPDALRASDTTADMVAVRLAGPGEPAWFYLDDASTATDDNGVSTIQRNDGVRYTRFPA